MFSDTVSLYRDGRIHQRKRKRERERERELYDHSPTRVYSFDIVIDATLISDAGAARHFSTALSARAVIYRLPVSGSLGGSNLFQLIRVNIPALASTFLSRLPEREREREKARARAR